MLEANAPEATVEAPFPKKQKTQKESAKKPAVVLVTAPVAEETGPVGDDEFEGVDLTSEAAIPKIVLKKTNKTTAKKDATEKSPKAPKQPKVAKIPKEPKEKKPSALSAKQSKNLTSPVSMKNPKVKKEEKNTGKFCIIFI